MNDTDESTAKLDEYKGKPMFVINPDTKFPFSFGLTKAKLVVRHMEAIKKFVDTNGKEI